MTRSKRDYSLMFARDDCLCASNGSPSVSTRLVQAAATVHELQPFASVIEKQKPRAGLSAPLKTTDAWQRRVRAVTLDVLELAARELGLVGDDDGAIEVHDLNGAAASEVVLADADDASLVSSVLSRRQGDGGTLVGSDDGEASAVGSTVVGSTVVGSTVVGSTVVGSTAVGRKDDARSAVGSTAVGSVVGRSDVRSAVSTGRASSGVSLIAPIALDESLILDRYKRDKSALDARRGAGEVRLEEYKRKAAALQVRYWTDLDVLRNRATPTVINGG